jgi:zinc transporter 1/2/3
MVELLTLGKIIFLLVIFGLALGTGMIPIKCKGFKESPKIIGIANAFSGGVFLAIALVHILPDVTESYQSYMLEN